MFAGAVAIEYLVLQRNPDGVYELLADEGAEIRIVLQDKVIQGQTDRGNDAEPVGDRGDTHI
jgi:hypothetical protein